MTMWSLLTLSLFAISAVHAVGINHVGLAARQNTTCSGSTSDKVAASWYAGWRHKEFPPENIPWSKYTHVTYAFAMTTHNPNNLSLELSSPEILPVFIEQAKKNNVKALISIGGWTGSIYFSKNVATPHARKAFIKAITNFTTHYQLDGVDFDWEYPNYPGIGCNHVSPDDAANFLTFLQELRSDPIGSNLILTAATTKPFNGPDGNPISDVSEFAKVFDYVALMNYDINGAWNNWVGPNAPLDDTCVEEPYRQGSAVSTTKAWTDAKFPAEKLVLGVPAYGRSFRVNSTEAFKGSDNKTLALFPAHVKGDQPNGDAWDDVTGEWDVCGDESVTGGIFNYWGLIDGGFLDENGAAKDNIHYRYDDCSQTPYVYDETSEVMISFDNIQSFASKGEFITTQGLRGFAIWQAGGDRYDALLDSIRQHTGIAEGDC